MASISGTLTISLGSSRINGLLLAVVHGQPNEFVAATARAQAAGLANGDAARADGSHGAIGNVSVFFVSTIGPVFAPATIAAKKAKQSTKMPKTNAATNAKKAKKVKGGTKARSTKKAKSH